MISAARGDEAQSAIGSRASAVGELAGEVVQSRAPVALADVEGVHAAADPILDAGHRAFLGAPLVGSEGTVHGVLAVYAREPRSWREEEIEAIAALAGNASAFLANAELYQRVVLERERSVAILGNVADGIVAVGRDGNVVLWNTAAEEITGVPESEALGRPPSDVLQRSLDPDETSDEGRGLIRIPRGSDEIWLSVTEAVMRDPAGAVAGRIYAFRNVSSDRLVEQLKSGFVSTVSHELRAPLTSIYGFAETLLREDVSFGDEERRTFLTYIASEAQRLTGIVDALLSVARLEAGDLQVQLTPTDLRDVVTDVVSDAQRELANGGRFVIDVPEEPLDAAADRDKVRQVLANLVDNAVKFSPEGGTVTVAARRAGDAVQVRVVDEGSGVPAGEQERIFRKFYRADAAGPSAGGTGLGSSSPAASPRRWADACGWTRTPDEGRASSSSCRRPGGRPMTKVLVIDDEAPIRLLCRVNLEAEKMDVLEAANGEEGLELARTEKPDIVLLDVMMPGMDGWQVAERLFESRGDEPDPARVPDGAGRASRPRPRSGARRCRLHHEAVQPGRARLGSRGPARTRAPRRA